MVNLLQVIAVTVSSHEDAVVALVIVPTMVLCMAFVVVSFLSGIHDLVLMHRLMVHRMRTAPSGFGQLADSWFGSRPAGQDVWDAVNPDQARTVHVSRWRVKEVGGVLVPVTDVPRR